MTDEQHESDDRLDAVLAELRGFAAGPPPEPSPALAALLGARGSDELTRRRLRDRRGIVAGIAVAGASATLALSGVAAAHDALPGPAEGVISGIVNSITPFRIDGDDPAPVRPTPSDVVVPSRAPAPPTATDDARDGSGGGGRGGSGGSDDGSGSGSGSGSGDDGSGSSGDGSGGSGSGDSGSGGSGSGDSGSDDSGSGDSGSGSGSGSGGSGSDSGSGSGGSGSGSGSGSDDGGSDGSSSDR